MAKASRRHEEYRQLFTAEVKAKNHREALLMAIADIKERWEFYRQRYERWMK